MARAYLAVAVFTFVGSRKSPRPKRSATARIEAVNIFDRLNPDTVVNNVDAPNFGSFTGGQSRAFTLRVRFAGRK